LYTHVTITSRTLGCALIVSLKTWNGSTKVLILLVNGRYGIHDNGELQKEVEIMRVSSSFALNGRVDGSGSPASVSEKSSKPVEWLESQTSHCVQRKSIP